MTIKPMAAGRTTAFVGLNFSWATIRDCDMVTVGCFNENEAREDIEISLAALERRVAALEASVAKIPGTLSSALSSEHQAIVADVNKALSASEQRTNKAIRDAVRSAPAASSGGGSKKAASGPPRSGDFYEWTVEPGQTLSQIAAAFNVPVQTIMKDNGITDASKLRAGQTLWIQAK